MRLFGHALAASIVFINLSVVAAVPPSVKSVLPEGDRLLYGRLVEAFRGAQLEEVARLTRQLEKTYPRSVHLDNALYMWGTLEFQQGRYSEALRHFRTVNEKFPLSNKRSSALFATGVLYQRLNLPKQARFVFERVMKEYPGSVESQRAWMQVQIEKRGLKTRTE
jgi:TolA-binding protein